MAAGDRILRPDSPPTQTGAFASHRVTSETVDAKGLQEAAKLVLLVDASGNVIATGALATAANQTAQSTLLGAVNETAPATDTASSGLNGRLQRIAQRITSLIALLPASLGQKTKAASLPVVIASDQDVLATAANQTTANTSLSSVDTKLSGTGSIKDNGPAWTVVRTYTESADMTTAAAISAAPTSGQKVIGDDILVSSDTAMNFKIQMETSTNVLAKVFIPANGTVPITLRDGIKGDATDKKLFGKASVAGNVAITVCQHSEV